MLDESIAPIFMYKRMTCSFLLHLCSFVALHCVELLYLLQVVGVFSYAYLYITY